MLDWKWMLYRFCVFRWWTPRPISLWPTRRTCVGLRSLWRVWCQERATSSQSQRETPRAEANPSGSTHSPPSYQINWQNLVRSLNVNGNSDCKCFGQVAWKLCTFYFRWESSDKRGFVHRDPYLGHLVGSGRCPGPSVPHHINLSLCQEAGRFSPQVYSLGTQFQDLLGIGCP